MTNEIQVTLKELSEEVYSPHLPDTYKSRSAKVGSSRTRKLEIKNPSKHMFSDHSWKLESKTDLGEVDVVCSDGDKV